MKRDVSALETLKTSQWRWTTDPATGSKGGSERCSRLDDGLLVECRGKQEWNAHGYQIAQLSRSGGSCGSATREGGPAVAEGHCSMAAPTLVIKKIIRIQTDKKMASDGTYYLITQRQGGAFSRKWNIKKNLFHMHCTCHLLN